MSPSYPAATRSVRLSILVALVGLLVVPASGADAASASFSVTNTNDDGPGSFRRAIVRANANPGLDTIRFNIAGDGPHTIQPTSALSTVTDAVLIDGFTQPGASPNTNGSRFGLNAVLMIELDGTNAGSGVTGLTITAEGSTVRGLVINGFDGDGLAVLAGHGNSVVGNFIGTDAKGTSALGNGRQGIYVAEGARSNVIGTNGDGVNDAAESNLISGNANDGVQFDGAGTNDNVLAGNLIGTDVTGMAALGNGRLGVLVNFGAQSNRIGTDGNGAADAAERNIISGNLNDGLQIAGVDTGVNSENNLVAGNFVGTDVTGRVALGNARWGVSVIFNANHNVINGNTVSYNADDGFFAGEGTNLFSENSANGNGGFGFNNIGSSEFVGNRCRGNAAGGSSPTGLCFPQP